MIVYQRRRKVTRGRNDNEKWESKSYRTKATLLRTLSRTSSSVAFGKRIGKMRVRVSKDFPVYASLPRPYTAICFRNVEISGWGESLDLCPIMDKAAPVACLGSRSQVAIAERGNRVFGNASGCFRIGKVVQHLLLKIGEVVPDADEILLYVAVSG